MKKQFLTALIFLLFLSTYNIQNFFTIQSLFKIKKIIIENNRIINERKILDNLLYLYRENLFLLNTKSIQEKLIEEDFIESFEIKKIYPSEIKIKIFEREPIAILQNKEKKQYYTRNHIAIKYIDLKEFRDLPIVFGDGESFKKFYTNLIDVNFSISEIKAFYLFESQRWDLLTKKNRTIKLPIKNYKKSLKNFLDLKDNHNFNKYKIFDYRIKNQLILK